MFDSLESLVPKLDQNDCAASLGYNFILLDKNKTWTALSYFLL